MEVGHLLFLQEQIKGIIIAQSVAKTLWASGTMRRATGSGLMRELPGLSEALGGTFTAQEVANTLWACATMGRAPGAGLMRELEGRAEAVAGTFTAQNVANTLDTVRVFSSSRLWRRNSMG
jgi:hypothetical protein